MVSLPEDRALLAETPGNPLEPVSLDPLDDETHRLQTVAQNVFDRGGYFSNADLHQLVARLFLGV